jgi:multimeric flavodoxin WrbA
MTRVIAINGSPRMEEGNTARLLSPFLEGMMAAGASVAVVYAKRLDAKPCEGDPYCWTTDPGYCFINDGMQFLYPKLREADILVLATPVYTPLPGEMQNLLNRLTPLMDSRAKWSRGRTRAAGLRPDVRISKMALVSTSGWWEKGNMETVLRIAKELARQMNISFAGALLRPHFGYLQDNSEKAEEIFDAAKQLGRQLIEEGKMSLDLLKVISQPLISKEMWRYEIGDSD